MSVLGLGMVLSAIGKLYAGVSKLSASKKQATALEDEGRLVLNEALRDASIVREDGRNFAASQSLQYISAGVELTGSALITLEQTRRYAGAEASAIEDRGAAAKSLADRKAEIARAEGRSGLVGSIIGAGASLLSKTTVNTKAETDKGKI